ncbi:leucine-rich repeat receptor protein kinase EMS1-like [Papaver somniferum]|uniref:leucine-rich repeat receptor protein kinase EMS1-like n=1 Tax=Papaver somniferum TaxID=3469 RepID=UPI000E70467E|nr:leucine-rich repeat receptor protein kinase EMS1-like [Papaver somniferum]
MAVYDNRYIQCTVIWRYLEDYLEKLNVVIDKHLNLYPNLKPKKLKLTSTNLKGSPTFICNLTGLVVLDLSRTNLTESVPSCLFKLKYLNELHLANNMFSGILPLPPRNLSAFDLSNNQLTGEISIETGKRLSNAKIILLYGVVPKEFEFAKDLQILLLNDNHLEGTIDSISGLHNLEYLNLANNNFGGSIPTALGSLENLNVLSLRSNKLCGPIPEEILHLQELCVLDLSLNNLSSNIPTKLGNLSGLTTKNSCYWFFDVDVIPENIGDLSALESLDLSSNRLTGHIPQSLTTIDTLGVLYVSYNNLSGKIPRGTHFDTLSLDGSAFNGNNLLCGFPTDKICKGDHNTSTSVGIVDEDDHDDVKGTLLLSAFIFLGFGVGFWLFRGKRNGGFHIGDLLTILLLE